MSVESEIGELREAVSTLKTENAKLKSDLAEVREILDRGRGAVWVLGALAAAVTFALTQIDRIAGALK